MNLSAQLQDRGLLVATLRVATSWRHALEILEASDGRDSYRSLKDACASYGLGQPAGEVAQTPKRYDCGGDTQSWKEGRPTGGSAALKITEEEQVLLNTATSVSEALRMLGIEDSSYQRRRLKQACESGGLRYPAVARHASPQGAEAKITSEKLIKIYSAGASRLRLLKALGCSPTQGNYGRLEVAAIMAGVSLPKRHKRGAPFVERSELEAAVTDSKSMRDVLKALGKKPYGYNQQKLKEAAAELGVELPKFDFTQNAKCTHERMRRPLDTILVEHSHYNPGVLKRRIIAAGLVANQCAECSMPPVWRGKELVFVLDHVNGEHTDNRIENLRLLCPNCNSQTDTFCGRNTARQRKAKAA